LRDIRTRHGILKRSHNFKEYWVCAVCHVTKHKKAPSELCYRCGSTAPPRMAIAYSWNDVSAKQMSRPRPRDGDRAIRRTRVGAELIRSVKDLKVSKKVRKTSAAVVEPLLKDPPVPARKTWYSQIFLSTERYTGEFVRDFCFIGYLTEIVNAMTERKMMQMRIPWDLYVWFKRYAARNNSTMTDLFIDHLKHLKRKEEHAVPVEQI